MQNSALHRRGWVVVLLLAAFWMRVAALDGVPPGYAYDGASDLADGQRIAKGVPFPLFFDDRPEPLYRFVLGPGWRWHSLRSSQPLCCKPPSGCWGWRWHIVPGGCCICTGRQMRCPNRTGSCSSTPQTPTAASSHSRMASPTGGQSPLWAWQPGEVIQTQHTLTLPARPAQLNVGFYHPLTFQRLPVSVGGIAQPDDALVLWRSGE